MSSGQNRHCRELAKVLEESAEDDGCHLGPTDAIIAAEALRFYADRGLRASLCSGVAAVALIAALARLIFP